MQTERRSKRQLNRLKKVADNIHTEYLESITLHKSVIDKALSIVDTTTSPRTQLEALRLITDSRRYLDSLTTDASTVYANATNNVGESHHVLVKDTTRSAVGRDKQGVPNNVQ